MQTNVTILITIFGTDFEVNAIWNGSRLRFPVGHKVSDGTLLAREAAEFCCSEIEKRAHDRIGGLGAVLADHEWPLSEIVRW